MKMVAVLSDRLRRINKPAPNPAQNAAERNALPDYSKYPLSFIQKAASTAVCGIGLWGAGYLFFHNWVLALMVSLAAGFAPRLWGAYLLDRRRNMLGIQFKQMLYSLSSSLAAGRSVENGFREAVKDLQFLYPDGNTDMIRELRILCARLEYGQPIEEALQDLSRRAGHEDITNFADVFSVCKRTGGDLVEVIRRTSTLIGEKMEISMEINVLLAQKKLESNLLLAAPVCFLAFMNLSSPDYMSPLYSGAGLMISAAALLLYGFCGWITRKIMNIRV
ncbi:type II secretion system F family protein [Paenibacillus pinistramenti]|uniref:type II secretion system F family protein n=1 Tax=Paenibacillus pinistramenti TaxID=1768003 RepID=UPI001EF0B241|nr:type II secretion system F family protein [Paenibacillus pinistramenti]